MANISILAQSHSYRDHDDCILVCRISTITEKVLVDEETQSFEMMESFIQHCGCGGWYYLPTMDEVYDF